MSFSDRTHPFHTTGAPGAAGRRRGGRHLAALVLAPLAVLVALVATAPGAGAQSYSGDGLGEVQVPAGGRLRVVGAGFAASVEVVVSIGGELITDGGTMELGRFTTNAAGELDGVVTIPDSLSVGRYTLAAVGPGASGGTLELFGTLVVGAQQVTTTTVAGTGDGTGDGVAPDAAVPVAELARTGSSGTQALVGAGAGILVVGTALLVARRRVR